MLGAAVLLAGVSLASAQGMKEGAGAGGPSPGMSGGEQGRAERPSMQDRTTGQGSSESKQSAPEPKAGKAQRQPDSGQAQRERGRKDQTTGQGSRESAQPSDTKAQPSDTKSKASGQPQPSQQPQRQQTQTPSDTKSGTTGAGTATQSQPSGATTQSQPSGAATQSQSGVTIDAQKQASIQQSVLSARNAPRVSNVNFAISTGTVVPPRVRFVSVSTFPILIETFPHFRDHVFFIVEDEIVILEPRTRRIVEVVPVGPRRVSRGGGTSVEVLQLSEVEIREVQLVLVQRGLLVQADVTGVLNERTKTALITFQRRQGLQSSGSIDVRTVSALGLSSKVGPQKTGATGSSTTTGQSPTGQAPAGTQQPAQPQQGQTGQQQPQQEGTTGQGQPSAQGQTPSTTGQSSAPSTTGQGDQPAQQGNPSATTGQGNAQQPAQNPQNQNQPSRTPQSNPSGTAPAR